MRRKSSSAPGSSHREAIFNPRFIEDLRFWIEADRAVGPRLLKLVEAVLRDPFQGPGKPEPLRHELAGTWSRRITQEHRLVYSVRDGDIAFLQCRHHY